MLFRLFRRAPRSNGARIEPTAPPALPAVEPINEPPPDRFTRRRRAIDRGMQTIADKRHDSAVEGGAIAAEWQTLPNSGGDCLDEHAAHSGKVFLIRDSWAMAEGLLKPGARPFMDEIERPGHNSGCNCAYTYVFSPRRLPEELLSEKALAQIAEGKRRMAALGIKVTVSAQKAP